MIQVAYVDTSVLVAIAFGEPGGATMARRLARFDVLIAADLVDAELQATFRREGLTTDPAVTGSLSWIIPDRQLRGEISQVLDHGPLRGADCWHLAVALYVAEDPGAITFLTLDQRQRAAAGALGFRI
jgi:predicted nucleic acid-binding protein